MWYNIEVLQRKLIMTEVNKGSQWKPGQTGNPTGRPRKDRDKVGDAELSKMKKLLDKHSSEAVQKIVRIMQNPPTPEMEMKASAWIVDKKLAVDKEVERRLEKNPSSLEKDVDNKPKAPVISFRMTAVDGTTSQANVALDNEDESE